ncbi:MAG: OsmC family protein [Chloroflexota bacterium]
MHEFARVETDQGYRTRITARTHTWNGDMPISADGTDTAANPEELLLGALGSCTTMTLHMYANRKGWDLQKVSIDLTLEKVKAEDDPTYDGDAKFVHRIEQKLTFHGDLDDKQRERLMYIAGRCPVHRILDGPTLTTETEVIAEAE